MKYNLPVRIYEQKDLTNAESLLRRKAMQIGLAEPDCSEMIEGGYVILDFGVETRGGVRILNHKGNNATMVRIRFGEKIGRAHV